MSTITKQDQLASKENLAAALSAATRDHAGRVIIYTVLRAVSSSGMSRVITPMVISAATAEPVSLAWDYERSQGRRPVEAKLGGQWACRVPGAGMDMGFHLADCIAWAAGSVGQGTEQGKQVPYTHRWL